MNSRCHVVLSPDAMEKMDAMMSSPTAWHSQYTKLSGSAVSTSDSDLKVPECAEAFVVLMTTILGIAYLVDLLFIVE